MNQTKRYRMFATAIVAISAIASLQAAAQVSNLSFGKPAPGAGAVFVMTNDADRNEIVAFARSSNGQLNQSGRFATGGRGSGGVTDPLESQGSLTLSQDHSVLFAANAGSGDISVFRVAGRNLLLVDRQASGGSQPVAVAERHGLVYVLNSGGAGSVVGFRTGFAGRLQPIKDATVFLSANATGGASLSISPDGQFVLVSERIANTIDAFRIHPDGTLGAIVVNPSSAPGAFSLQFAPDGKAIVSETGPAGASHASTISSYSVTASGALVAVSQSVPAFGDANCWNAITPDGKHVYTSNAASASISGFNIGDDGTLTPIGSTVVGNNPPGSTNLDIAVTADGQYLYTINSGTGDLGAFRIEHDGTLTSLGQAGELPKSSGFNGIAAL
ncbi:MAG: beta-propeller fold lactonase family protein [Edaphobacter sp.]|uniref:lactonase family protein n=1 Tax=Edaphobacter sp. TaxID=1934404 RepID=UPI00239DC8E8|nr:beta-propeller fold lactonase family protein [Edaphobacter sp.]MDE1178761.1 beta-propeller fold lactonase family protein [Edaphobacter sp.]